jgi:phosphatidate cytidylyltransferase
MLKRIIVGAIFIAALLAMATVMPLAFGLLIIAGIAAWGQWEFYAILETAGYPAHRILGMVAGVALVTTAWFADSLTLYGGYSNVLLSILALSVVAVLIMQLKYGTEESCIPRLSGTFLGILYTPLLFSFMALLANDWAGLDGRLLVMYLISVVKMSDIGAYFTGRFLGKHKMVPRISPKKTWEGFAGGVGGSCLAGFIWYHFTGGDLRVVHIGIPHVIIIPILLAILGVLGDLVESLFKRSAAVKDSSQSVPGMGGILDVVDSLLLASPVLYIYVQFVLL